MSGRLRNDPKKRVCFYDGTPFATGMPHYGTSSVRLERRGAAILDHEGLPRVASLGWDCHGLPIENMIEKELHLNSKRDIENYGIEKFNAACRASVSTYEKEWDRYIKRLGRWVDFENSYKPWTTITSSPCGGCSPSFIKNLSYTKTGEFHFIARVAPRRSPTSRPRWGLV